MMGRRRNGREEGSPTRRPFAIILIGVEKFAGALLAVAVAAFAIADGGRGLAAPVALAITAATDGGGRPLLTWAIAQLSPGMVGWGVTAGVYGILLFAEAVGVLRQRGWAEVVVLAETALWIPVEAYSLVTLPSLGEAALLAMNLAILAYLLNRRRTGWRQDHHGVGGVGDRMEPGRTGAASAHATCSRAQTTACSPTD